MALQWVEPGSANGLEAGGWQQEYNKVRSKGGALLPDASGGWQSASSQPAPRGRPGEGQQPVPTRQLVGPAVPRPIRFAGVPVFESHDPR